MPFDTPLSICGPLRRPQQMLADQEYGGHTSIHDDAMAEKLGFRAGPIEGPTHFSQFVPLLAQRVGRAWFERGCFSAHYQNMVVEGEEVRAFVALPPPAPRAPAPGRRRPTVRRCSRPARASAPTTGRPCSSSAWRSCVRRSKLVILADLRVGMTGAEDERVRMDADQHMGALYPFSLKQKLARITENSPGTPTRLPRLGAARSFRSRWSACSPSTAARRRRFPVKGPAVGLFADQEIRMVDGPLFVGEDYLIRREIVALSESKRTESYWVRTRIYDASRQASSRPRCCSTTPA